MIDGIPLTLTTGSMNRLSALRRALPTWLALDEVDRYVVVDWSSRESLVQALGDFNDPRLIIVRAVGQAYWRNAACHNLEIYLASQTCLEPSGFLLRLDNDVLVRRDFLARHPPRLHGFYAGNWRTVPSIVDDKRNLSGTLLARINHVKSVGGYNERLVHYGREDDDLYARLTISGYRWHELDLETLEHIPHTNCERFKNLAAARDLSSLVDRHLSAFIALSDDVLMKQPWTTRDKPTSWEVDYVDPLRYWVCREISGSSK